VKWGILFIWLKLQAAIFVHHIVYHNVAKSASLIHSQMIGGDRLPFSGGVFSPVLAGMVSVAAVVAGVGMAVGVGIIAHVSSITDCVALSLHAGNCSALNTPEVNSDSCWLGVASEPFGNRI
jgi:hypothetical protein